MDETLSRPSCFYDLWFRRTFLLSDVETNNVIDMYCRACLKWLGPMSLSVLHFLSKEHELLTILFPDKPCRREERFELGTSDVGRMLCSEKSQYRQRKIGLLSVEDSVNSGFFVDLTTFTF